MSKCKNDMFLGKIRMNKLSKETEVTFNVLDALPECRIIRANKVVNDVVVNWARYDIPQNRFECEAPACGNSGTAYVGANEAIYFVHGDATEWASGVITFYVKNATQVVVKVSDTKAMTNADSYTITVGSAGADGFAPVVVDLSQTGTAVGDGYTPSASGAFISITPTGSNAGISSIGVYDSMDDFAINAVVKISCLSGIEGDTAIEAAEATCWDEGYDTSSDISLERTITGKLLTPNFNLLNPLLGKGNRTDGFEDVTVDMVVGEDGTFTISDAFAEECGFYGAMVADPCNITDSMLDLISIPVPVALTEKQYQIIEQADGVKQFRFNTALAGKHVVVSYPRAVEIENWIADERNLNTRKVRMTVPYCTSDGVRYVKVFNNVLITSFPEGITNEENEFEFTIAIRKDSFGHFYHLNRILG